MTLLERVRRMAEQRYSEREGEEEDEGRTKTWEPPYKDAIGEISEISEISPGGSAWAGSHLACICDSYVPEPHHSCATCQGSRCARCGYCLKLSSVWRQAEAIANGLHP